MASRVALGPIETVTVNSMVMGPRTTVTIGSSPCTLINSCSTRILVGVSAGTVTAIEMDMDGNSGLDLTGLLGGQFFLNPGTTLRITYVVAPTVIFFPM